MTDHHWAAAFWGDHFQATVFEAPATSKLAADLRAVLAHQHRAAHGVLAGADVGGLCDDLGLDSEDLAETLEIALPSRTRSARVGTALV